MRVGEVYENPVTGERMEVLDATEEMLVVDFRIAPGGAVPAEHVHPSFAESFEVLEGEVTLRVGGKEVAARAGDRHVVHAGAAHAWWNTGDTEARIALEITPPGRFGDMIATVFQLARDGETNAKGMPSLLQIALFAQEMRETVYMARPPLPVQRLVFALLAPVARMRGYQPLRAYRHDQGDIAVA